MLYTTMRTFARMLANDPNGAVVDADVLQIANDMYQTYWMSFLRDRLTLIDSFVQFSAGEYIVEAAYECREVQSLVRNISLPQSAIGSATGPLAATPAAPMERDDFEAVVADAEAYGADTQYPLRYGIRMKDDNSKAVVAIHPQSSAGITLDAWVYKLPNTLSTTVGAGDLQGDDNDGYAVGRLVACAIMAQNGDDASEIERVFQMLDQKVKDKFNVVKWRTQPREREDKEQ